MTEFRVPSAGLRHEIEVKRSRFIASVGRAPDRLDAEQFIAAVRAEFTDATHNTYAYIAGLPGSTGDIACSDDGEVAGTAGRPILNLLQHSGLAEVVVVVTRYYGGTLLGTGGLVRAYSQVVKEVLEQLPTEVRIRSCAVQIGVAFALEAAVRRELGRLGAAVLDAQHGEQVRLQIQVAETSYQGLRATLEGVTKGQLIWKDLDS